MVRRIAVPRCAAFLMSSFLLTWALSSNSVGQAPAPTPASDWPAFQKTVLPFLVKHCFECHTDKQNGDVRLDQFRDDKSLAKGSAILDRVQVMLRKQTMPPRKRAQPSAEAMRPVLSWLETFSERLEQASRLDRVTLRRLNRTEYNNTIRDLLGVD